MDTSNHGRRRIALIGRTWATSVMILLSAAVLDLGVCLSARAADPSRIKADEDVVFFPGFATEAVAPSWTGFVHGWIFEPVSDPRQREALEALLLRRLNLSREETRSKVFRDRSRMFLVDNERSKRLAATVSGRLVVLAPSKSNGHFEDQITLKEPARKSGDWIEIRPLTRPGDRRDFPPGGIQLIGRRGVSIVSDIDDTIKISNVLDKPELVANTFVREFRPVPGMADLYRSWAAGGNVVFHYVSGGPWQLYPSLSDFTREEGFPRGTFNFRPFRLKDESAVEFLENRTLEYKIEVIDALMRRFPERQFVLVGDSGEKDSDVYAALASRSRTR
jgi:phosphatidate phosphatase APP1